MLEYVGFTTKDSFEMMYFTHCKCSTVDNKQQST